MQEFIPPKLPLDIEFETKNVLKKSITANRALAKLNGVAKIIPNQTILINALSLQEAKDSSEIENIITTHDELYKADIKLSHISKETKEVQNYKTALLKGFELVQNKNLLLKRDIVEIQKVLEQNQAGIRKQSGTKLKNIHTGEVVFNPPQNYQDIDDLFTNLEKYINEPNEIDTLVNMAIIHYQFETIHPFYDGNGRTGRIINILYLILNNLLDIPILYLSRYIIKNKSNYYKLLQEVRTKHSWEEWIIFMLDGIESTSLETIKLINQIKSLMNEDKAILKTKIPKVYSKDLLEVLYKHPYTKIDFLINELNIHRDTASKHLKELEKVGILQSIKIGRSKFFINIKLFELFKKGI
jgi:Fic family protein